MSEKTKATLLRAFHTFWQTALAYIIGALAVTFSGVNDLASFKSAAIGLLVAALSAGLSAVKNALITPPECKDCTEVQ